ncbi:MAG: HAD-IC family P-type ATPase, partial [Oscillospiraceae bacterium]|nr:HAD-IC family P-type ATPase [Oscillospiraceae bacterium]
VHHSPIPEEKLLEYAAHAECHSSHPINRSLREAYGKYIDQTRVTDVQEISGHGIIAKVDGEEVAIGNEKLMKKIGAEYHECHHVGTIIHVAVNGRYCGHIVISDELKEHSREAMLELKKAGVEKTVMLTGDAESVAKKVAEEVGLTDYRAQLLPADKVSCVEELLKECTGSKRLAFVGDGINDAPVLSRADIGIAMGALGSDAAIEAADIVLMDDDPLKIAKAIKISRKCLSIVKQNIGVALGVKALCLSLAALGIANMWIAIISDVGVMILAVLNAIRCLFVKNL